MKRFIFAIALTAVAACTEAAAPETTAPSPLKFYVAADGPCENGFVQVTVDKPACGIALEPNGSLVSGERHYAPIIVSYQQGADGQVAIPAKKITLFPPSPRQGFRIIRACEETGADSLCWAVRVMDPSKDALRDAAAGKYGPELWIRWSPEESRVALISRTEGSDRLHVVETATGTATVFPAEAENANLQIDQESFSWSSDEAFAVTVKTCESCAPEQRRFSLPLR